MTRIVVLCDGTWNDADSVRRTHVAALAEALVSDPREGQVVAYFAGIGTDRRFDGPVARVLNRWGGGAFGWGLDAKVKQAYQFVARAYRAGDSIHAFGFSRGAFTARSVVGMIRKCGIVEDTSPEGINAAFDLYRTRGTRGHPDHPEIRAARKAMSPRFATSPEDVAWRQDASALIDVAYVGVWDTVGARGIPVSLLGPVAALWNRQYRFHDTSLSRLVGAARHALALDETRIFFVPAAWDNLDRLNGGAQGAARPYRQAWFAGDHAIVGGSAGVPALSAFALEWILEGARDLRLRPGHALPSVPGDAAVETARLPPPRGLLRRWRRAQGQEVHPSVGLRLRARREYRPGSLADAPAPAPSPGPGGPER